MPESQHCTSICSVALMRLALAALCACAALTAVAGDGPLSSTLTEFQRWFTDNGGWFNGTAKAVVVALAEGLALNCLRFLLNSRATCATCDGRGSGLCCVSEPGRCNYYAVYT